MWEPQPAGNTEGVSDCNGSVLCVKYFETWRCGVCVWCVWCVWVCLVWCVCGVFGVCVCVYGVCVWCKLNCVAAKEPRHTAHTAMQHISSCTSPYSSLRTSVCLSDRNAVRKWQMFGKSITQLVLWQSGHLSLWCAHVLWTTCWGSGVGNVQGLGEILTSLHRSIYSVSHSLEGSLDVLVCRNLRDIT